MQVTLEKYSREQLEDMRNKLRTRLFQHEGSVGITDLLTNETYQKDKAMMDLLNTRIKEMLGEDIKKLKDKMVELSEAKKGVRAPKFTKKAKGTKDYDGDGKIEPAKDEVWGSRAKAAAKAGKPFQEGMKDKVCSKCGEKQHTGKCAVEEEVYTGASEWKQTSMSLDAAKKKYGDANAKIEGKNRLGEPIVVVRTGGVKEGSKPDFLDLDKDGNKKEPMKSASKEKKMKESSNPFSKDYKSQAEEPKGSKTGHQHKKTSTGDVYTKKAAKDDPVKKESVVAEKAESKAQQKFMGMVHAAKKGEKPASKEVAKAAKGMSKKAAKDFASTKHKGLPEKKKKTDESYRRNVRIVNESLSYLINEDEEEKAKAITAAGDMANDFTSWMQRVGQYQTKVMIELSDEIRHNFGAAEAEAFKQAVSPALSSTLEVLTQQREVLSNAIAALAGGQVPAEPMGAEPGMDAGMPPPEAPMEPAGPDELNPLPTDEFGASDAAAGAGTPGREMRESKFARKLAESHSIMSKLAR